MKNRIQIAIEQRDRAVQVALNFVGQHISSSDGSYELLIDCIHDALIEEQKQENNACGDVAGSFVSREIGGPTARYIEEAIRKRMDKGSVSGNEGHKVRVEPILTAVEVERQDIRDKHRCQCSICDPL
jgi:hypothetical protein